MLQLEISNAVEALNGGLFVSPGYGKHPTRIIDSYELIFVVQGRLDMFEEMTTYHLGRFQTLLLFPGKRHGGLYPYPSDLNFYWVHFRLRDASSRDVSIEASKVAAIREPEELTELFCQFISDQESGLLEPLSAGHLVSLMLCEIDRAAGIRKPAPSAAGADVRREPLPTLVHRYIDANFQKPITSAAIARDLMYSPDYLERLYRRTSEMSITEALNQKRIAAARALLMKEGRKNVNEIAFACGYMDRGYFRRVFKKITGLTPTQFRTLFSRTHINTH